jgi:hypothetical protein
MKCLSIRQPYTWCLAAGLKPVENRSWWTNYRGPVLLHAGLKPDADMTIEEIEKWQSVTIDRTALHYGGIVGRANLVRVVTSHPSSWFSGPYGFVFEAAQHVPFFKLRGQQGLFDVPDALGAVLR